MDSKGAHIQQFKNNTPGDDCVNGFLKRHQNVSVEFSANIKKTRANITADDISRTALKGL